MNEETLDLNNIPELSDKQLEYVKELYRHQEAMKSIEEKTKQIQIEQEEKSVQKKCDVGISFGDAIKALAPVLLIIVGGVAATAHMANQNQEVQNEPKTE